MNWTAATTNPTLGSGGFTEGKYVRLFPRLVIVYFRIWTGTGATAGSGQYRINAPFPFDPVISRFTEVLPIGKAAYFDASAMVTCSVFIVTYRVSDGLIVMRPPEGGFWDAAFPVAFGPGDRCSGYFMYPTAAA